MLPSRCLRCGAVGRDFLCSACMDYLVAYRPLWLDPALLPGPSLLDTPGGDEVAIVSTDLSEIEWRRPRSEPTSADAVRLIRFLAVDEGARPAMSVGDADVLHAFLSQARRALPDDSAERAALAALYRYLASCPWLPSHLAGEYRIRANVLEPAAAHVPEESVTRTEGPIVEPVVAQEPQPETGPSPSDALAPSLEEPAETPPARERGQPVEEPRPVPAPPQPEPPSAQPEPEMIVPDEAHREADALRERIGRERAEVEAWVRSRSAELQAKEEALAERERALIEKAESIEARERAVTERLVSLEKDAARREVLRFLGTVPGMTEAEADVIATAFPDMSSLEAADIKALMQCRGVTEALARAIRYELVPGEVEAEEHGIHLREEAQAFLEEGDYEGALDCYRRLLKERPEDTSIWFDCAELLVLLDRPEEALQCYRRVLELDRANRQAWFERANLLFGLGRLADAVDALREALRIEPSRAEDILIKAEQLRRDGHPNEAAILFQAVLDVHPDDARGILGLGDTLLDLGDIDAAEGLFTRALGRNLQNAPILFRKGELLERKGRWGAAIQYFNRAIALRWNYAEPWLAKAEVLLRHDRASEALECFAKVLSFEPDRADAWAGKARAHAALQDRAAAKAALERALQLDPAHPGVTEAREALARMRDAAAPPSEEREPAVPEAFAEFEAQLSESEEPASGAAAVPADLPSFVESVEPEREDAHVLVQLAELALEAGDPRMALLRYEQAIEREPRNADAWTGKGVSLQQLERYTDALNAYDRALSLKPDHELARRWRSTCVRRLEQEGTP